MRLLRGFFVELIGFFFDRRREFFHHFFSHTLANTSSRDNDRVPRSFDGLLDYSLHYPFQRSINPPHTSQHKQGTFDQACLGLSRKLFSLEQFSKFVKTRTQITTEYAHALEKLSQKSLSYLYFEESGVCKAWNKLVRMEAEIARIHSSLAECLQNQVFEQLVHLKDASEKIRKNVCDSTLQPTNRTTVSHAFHPQKCLFFWT